MPVLRPRHWLRAAGHPSPKSAITTSELAGKKREENQPEKETLGECVSMYVGTHRHRGDNFPESILSFLLSVGSEDPAQVYRLGGKDLTG